MTDTAGAIVAVVWEGCAAAVPELIWEAAMIRLAIRLNGNVCK